jgi:hypothetical protein
MIFVHLYFKKLPIKLLVLKLAKITVETIWLCAFMKQNFIELNFSLSRQGTLPRFPPWRRKKRPSSSWLCVLLVPPVQQQGTHICRLQHPGRADLDPA